MATKSATYSPLLRKNVTAGAALSANRFVAFDGTAPTADKKAFGVTEYSAEDTEEISLVVRGTAVVEASAEISLGDAVTTTADGSAKSVSSTEAVNGYALEAASEDGDLIEVLLV